MARKSINIINENDEPLLIINHDTQSGVSVTTAQLGSLHRKFANAIKVINQHDQCCTQSQRVKKNSPAVICGEQHVYHFVVKHNISLTFWNSVGTHERGIWKNKGFECLLY